MPRSISKYRGLLECGVLERVVLECGVLERVVLERVVLYRSPWLPPSANVLIEFLGFPT